MPQIQDYFAMGGYGFYVWGAYGIAVLALGAVALASWLRLRRALHAVNRADRGRGT